MTSAWLRRARSAAFLGVLACAACGGPRAGVASPNRAAFDIAEAVLRHMLVTGDAGFDSSGAEVVCVAIGDSELSGAADSAFLRRFKNETPPVHPWAQCAYDSAHDDRLAFVPTGDAAIGYAIQWPRQVTSRRVHVAVAWHLGLRDAAGYACEVAMDDEDRWFVESCKRRWVA